MAEIAQENKEVPTPKPKDKKIEYRITTDEFATMFVFAVIFDIIGLIPVVNILTVIMAQCLFALVFWANGVNIWQGKKLLTVIFTDLAKFIPGAPGATTQVCINTALSRAEDRLKAIKDNK